MQIKTRINTMVNLGLVAGLVLGVGVGCGGLEPGEEGADPEVDVQEQPMTMLVRVPMDDGNVVEFYEAAPGVILVGQAGELGTAPSVSREQLQAMEPEALLEAIKPAAMPVPGAFYEAMQRRQQLLANPPQGHPAAEHRPGLDDVFQSDPADADGIASSEQALSGMQASGKLPTSGSTTWFYDNFCYFNEDFAWCDLNRTGMGSRKRSDIHYAALAVAATYKSIRWRVEHQTWWSWSTYGTWTVYKGYWRRLHLMGGYLDWDLRSSVLKDCSVFDFDCMLSADPKWHHAGWGG